MGFTGNDPLRFTVAGREYVLTDRLHSAQGTAVVFHDALQAELFFHQVLDDAASLERLRKWVGTDPGRCQDLDAHRLVDDVAQAVSTGTLTLTRLSPDTSAKGQKVLERFHERIERSMTMTARDLLNPNVQPIEGHPGLKQIPPEQLKDALVDMFLDLPLGDSDLGREFAEVLQSTAVGSGRDLMSLSPRELGSQVANDAKEWAKDRVDRLRKEHPAVFWSLATAAFVGAGALVYSQGTGIAAKVGFKPEFEQKLADGKVVLKEKVELGPKLTDPKLSLDATTKLADGHLDLSAGATAGGSDFGHLKMQEYRGSATLREGGTSLTGSGTLDGEGQLQRYGVSASHTWSNAAGDRLTATGSYQRDLVTNSELLTGGISGKSGAWDYSVTGSHDFVNDATKVTGDIGRKVGDSGRLSGFVEQTWGPSGNDTRAGIMFTLSF